jgi:hypothetical protein
MNGVFGSGPEPGAHDPADLDPGVLGRLPRSRPAKRSPRREATARPAASPPSSAAAPSPEPARGVVEDVARAGLGMAVGAAEVGFRIAGRALGAIRGAAPRG